MSAVGGVTADIAKSVPVDEPQRHTVRRLLAEEEAKLAALEDGLSRPAIAG
jgi:hypothetical protein